ncbi:MAG: DUF2339 domain-containing protein [Candidatus Nomurabacteria bacterium]|nr:DUF2339 domain-containing protein [Candidatus Nomurabacteria bacterium]USN87440.1 MAG: DUF2339 domain-containing protein [Candidatus Nomurabacteria bacterium]
MTFILTILLFALFLSHLKLKERFNELEKKIKPLISTAVASDEKDLVSEQRENVPLTPPPPAQTETDNTPDQFASSTEVDYAPKVVHEVASKEEDKEFFLVSWFRENTLIKIGSIIFFLGAVWLVTYAVVESVFSPLVLLLLGFVLALLAYLVGFYRASISTTEYVVLTALGTGIISATIFTAKIIATPLPPVLALGLLVIGLVYTIYVSWQTNTKWLAIVTALAGLLIPMLVGVAGEGAWILTYLLILSVGLLFVGVKQEWRTLSMILTLGVSFYELGLLSYMNGNVLWFFVVIFTILFFVSVTMSFIKTKEARTTDVLSLAIAGLVFVFFASQIALSAGLATTIATIALAGVAYLSLVRNYPINITATYIAFSLVSLLIATSFVFSGFTEILAYTIEITAVFFIVTYLGLPERVMRLVAFGYLLPLITSLSSFDTVAWKYGILHADAFVLYSVMTSFIISALWLSHNKTLAVYRWNRPLAGLFGAIGYFYTLGVSAQVTSSIFSGDTALVMLYVVWALMSLAGIYYTTHRQLASRVIVATSLTLIPPIMASLSSLTSPAWREGIFHIHGFGVGVMFGVMILSTLLFTQIFTAEYNQSLKRSLGVMIVVTISYIFIALSAIFDSWLPYPVGSVLTYSSYIIILYALISLFTILQTNLKWVGVALLALILPLLLSFDSFDFSGWEQSEVIKPLGLFIVITIMTLIGVGLRKYYRTTNPEDREKVTSWSKTILITASLFAVGYFWSLTHSFLNPDKAVALSLFVFTVIGLGLYQYGKRTKRGDYKRAGQALLIFVVARLVIIDVWSMELLWRIVTFLGIGVLFITTALLEKQNAGLTNKSPNNKNDFIPSSETSKNSDDLDV